MATRTTTFPDGARIRAFRAVDAILREDPALLAAGVRFRSWDGNQVDGTDITSGQCPLIRVSPKLMPNEALTQSLSLARVGVKIEMYVAGMMAEDLVNFSDAVEAAMVRSKPFRGTTVQCYIDSRCGATRTQFVRPGFGSWESKDLPDVGLAGSAEFHVTLLTNA